MFKNFRMKKATEWMEKANELFATGDYKKIMKGFKYAKKSIRMVPIDVTYASEWKEIKNKAMNLSEAIDARMES